MNRRQFIKTCAAAGITASLPSSAADGWQHHFERFENHGKTVSAWIRAEEFCHVAVWNECLTAEELDQLSAGASPLRVRPDGLELYCPMFAGDEDIQK